MANIFKFLRGNEANRAGQTPASGRALWTEDDKILYVGDGVTAGGVKVGPYGAGDFVDLTSDQNISGIKNFTQITDALYLRIANSTLTVDDQFYIYASNTTTPSINFDSGASFSYPRGSAEYTFKIGFANQLTLSATEANFQDNDISLSGDINQTGGGGIVQTETVTQGLKSTEVWPTWIGSINHGGIAGYESYSFDGSSVDLSSTQGSYFWGYRAGGTWSGTKESPANIGIMNWIGSSQYVTGSGWCSGPEIRMVSTSLTGDCDTVIQWRMNSTGTYNGASTEKMSLNKDGDLTIAGTVLIGHTDASGGDYLDVLNDLRVRRSSTQYTRLENSSATGGRLVNFSAANNAKPFYFDSEHSAYPITSGSVGYNFRIPRLADGATIEVYKCIQTTTGEHTHIWQTNNLERMRIAWDGTITTRNGRLVVTGTTSADGGWTDGILLENTGTAGEAALAWINSATGSNYWIQGLNQDAIMRWGYGTSFSNAATKMILTDAALLGIGSPGTTRGSIQVYGGTGSSIGGFINLYTDNDSDTTYDYFRLSTQNEGFTIGPSTDADGGVIYTPATSLWNFRDNAITTTGIVTGENVTSGQDPGHQHTDLWTASIATDATYWLTFVNGLSSGYRNYYVDTNISYNPSTNILTVPTVDTDLVTIGAGVKLSESTHRADLLLVESQTTGYAGIQIDNTATETVWSLMADGTKFGVYDDTSNAWAIECIDSGQVKLHFAGVEKLSTITGGVDVTGDVLLATAGDGIAFGTQVDANTLDDYEEGSYTPALTGLTSGSYTASTTADTLAYTKVGRVVHVQGRLQITSENSPSGRIKMTLPFVVANMTDTQENAFTPIVLWNHGGSTARPVFAFQSGQSHGELYYVTDIGSLQTIDETLVDANWYININFNYVTTD